jgi:hypothetical protein
MTPPIFHLDSIGSEGIHASPSIMSIKIKGNSETGCLLLVVIGVLLASPSSII